MTYRTIRVTGFHDIYPAFWDGHKINYYTSINIDAFDFGDRAEDEFEKCKAYIKSKEQNEGWIPGKVECFIDEADYVKIKHTDAAGRVNYPGDLNGLIYEDAVTQLDLLEQGTSHSTHEADRQGEDVLVLNYPGGEFEIYEIED